MACTPRSCSAGSATRSPCGSATPPMTRSASASCSPTRRSPPSRPPTRRPTPRSHASFARWGEIDIYYRGELATSGGHGFSALEPQAPAQHPAEARRRPRRELHFLTDSPPLDELAAGYDLVICCRRRQQPVAHGARRRVRAVDRPAPVEVHLARHRPGVRGVHLPHRRDRVGRLPAPRLPVRRRR